MKNHLPENDKEILKEISKWCVNHISPVCIIDPEIDKDDFVHSAGTCSFIDTGKRKLIVTNYHIIEEFRKCKSIKDNICFRIENIFLDPLKRLIDEDKKMDIATLSINQEELDKLKKQCCSCGNWPPEKAKEGEAIVFAGYPGMFRKRTSINKVKFEIVTIMEFVKSSSDFNFTIYIDETYKKKIFGYRNPSDLTNLGGFSGSLVFRVINNRIMILEPIGIIYEGNINADMLIASHIDYIKEDGTIRKGII